MILKTTQERTPAWLVCDNQNASLNHRTGWALSEFILIRKDLMSDIFILIPGRTSKQGTTLNEGKYTEGYQTEINTLKMNPDDMQRLGIAEGEEVRMWNEHGSVVVPCSTGKDELPPGVLFISYGDKSSQLMPGETHGSGMPDSKGLDVKIEKLSSSLNPNP